MSLHVEENYVNGVPQTAVAGFAPRGLSWHWTAGGTGRAGAESTIRHFVNTRYTVNASYHILLWWEAATKRTYAMWIVPVSRASHSMNPSNAFKAKTGSARETARFNEVHRILARDNDPNADCISISFCGMPADLSAAAEDPVFRADVLELARQLIAHPTIIDRPHFGHGWIQPISRYETDIASGAADILIAPVLYATAAPAPQEEEDMAYDWVTQMRPSYVRGTVMIGVPIRTAPISTDDSFAFNMPNSGRTINFIGEVPDLGGGSIPYLVYPLAAGGLRVTRKDNIEGGVLTRWDQPATETIEVIKEVIKEVPTGITEDDLEEAAEAERSRIAAAEAQRIREI